MHWLFALFFSGRPAEPQAVGLLSGHVSHILKPMRERHGDSARRVDADLRLVAEREMGEGMVERQEAGG
eukprot:6186112-Pleurochrysis_carterae.AAC.6